MAPEDFESYVKQHFEDANIVLEKWTVLNKPKDETPIIKPREKSLNRKIESEEKNTITSFYIGEQKALRLMQESFKKRIVNDNIYNIESDIFVNANDIDPETGLTKLNKNIVKYKFDLINTIREAIIKDVNKNISISVDYNIDPQSFTELIESTKQLVETHINQIDSKTLDAYVILSKFDDLIKQNTPFIQVKKMYLTSEFIFNDQYEYKGPNVEHFVSFTSSDYANAFEQASDLSRILLDVFPELNSTNTPIENTSIGLEGFTSAMSSLKTALMYPINGSPIAKISSELYKGANINMSKVLGEYISWISTEKNINDKRRSYLITKLRAIKHYIYDSNLNSEIKNMFTAMFIKNVPVKYEAYQYDIDTKKVKGKSLEDSLVNMQKYRLQDTIISSISVFKNNPEQFKLIKNKYNISDNKGAITISPNGINDSVTINYKYKNGRYVFTTTDDLDENITKDLIKDLISYMIPSDYMKLYEQTVTDPKSLFQNFASIIGLVITSQNKDVNYPYTSTGLIDLSSYHTLLDPIANIISIIYGADTISVIKNLEGNSVPTVQLINLAQNIPAMIYKLKNDRAEYIKRTNRKRYNVYDSNLILTNDGFISQPFIRSNININGVIKSPSKLTTGELMQIAIIQDFYDSINTGTIKLQATTFADKNTHFIIPFNIEKQLTVENQTFTFKDLIEEALSGNSDSLINLYSDLRASKINNVVANIIADWNEAYNQNFYKLEEINDFIKNNKLKPSQISKQFQLKGIDCFENIHYYKDPKSGQIAINETIFNWKRTFDNTTLIKKRLDNNRYNFISGLFENGIEFNIYKNSSIREWTKTPVGSKWYDKNSGDLIYAKTNNGEIITKYNYLKFDPSNIILNPFLDAYFLSDAILSNEYMSLAMGEIYAHPNKNKEGNFYDDKYFEYSEANRLIAQNKRAVIMGGTHHPFIQHMKYGVAPTIKIAVMEDIPGNVFNMFLDDKPVDSMDGSGISSPLEARMENKSLLDANVGYDKKTLMGDVDPIYGRPTLLKWAVYALTNSRRQLGQKSEASAELLFKKMHNIPIGKEINISNYFDKLEKPIYFYDYEKSKWYYIDKVNLIKTETGYKLVRILFEAKENGNIFGDQIIQEFDYTENEFTLYSLDQLFGGAYSGELDELTQELKYSERNLDLLMEIVCNENLKDKFIAYAVNKSAIKVGAGNINSVDKWKNLDNLSTISMSTAFGGVQMDADHEIDDAEVTEMTQMLSSIIQNGNSYNIVNEVYRDIGQLVSESLSEYINAANEKNRDKMYRLLGEALIDAFLNNDRDTIGLAQSFIMKANKSLQDNNLDYKIPFSAPTINGAFIATITSLINKRGIRRKYAGFAGVLNPSHDMIQYYRVDGITYTFNKFADAINRRKVMLDDNNPWKTASIDQYINEWHLGNSLNPYVTLYNDVNDIDFEDTVIIVKNNPTIGESVEKIVHIDSWATYDLVKHRLDKTKFRFYNWKSRPKNLKQSNTFFTISVNNEIKKFSTYDLDSVRVSHYLNNSPSKQEIDITRWASNLDNTISEKEISNIIQSNKNEFIKSRYGESTKENPIDYQTIANKETSEIFKAIEDGRSFKTSTIFGLEESFTKANSYYVEPAEIICGKRYITEFGLSNKDDISDIMFQREAFFKSKLLYKYTLPNIDPNIYDFILYTEDGEEILVKYGSKEEIEKDFANIKNISKDSTFKIIGDTVYFKDDEFTSVEGKDFYSYLDNNGKRHNIITVNDLTRVTELKNESNIEFARTNYRSKKWKELSIYNQKLFENIPNFNFEIASQYKFIEQEEKSIEYAINKISEKKFKAFQQSLLLIGARIPTQGMQSYMPLKIIAFTDSEVNDIYVPKAQTWLQGSDYDIDKLYVMSFSVNKGGNIIFNANTKNREAKERALQNRVVNNILKVITSPKNQINLHMPIDMGPAQNAASKSQAGEVVKHVTADNPIVKYMMQVQNMVGKEVIGITAVSIKAFFAATYYYNDKIKRFTKELLNNNLENLSKFLNDIILINPLNYSVTSYANLNFDELIDVIKQNPNLANLVVDNIQYKDVSIKDIFIKSDNSSWTLLELINHLNDLSIQEDATLNLSALLSAATDNAKELILSKINATSKFVDIYTYLLTLGDSFKNISDIMKSPIFNEVVKLTETDIFDPTTYKYKLQPALSFYTDVEVLPGVDKNVLRYFAPDYPLKYDKNSRENFNIANALNKAYKFLKNSSNIDLDVDIMDMLEDSIQEMGQDVNSSSNSRNFALQPITKMEVMSVITFLNKCLERKHFLDNNPDQITLIDALRKINTEIIPATKEMEVLGAMLGVNQGLKTNDYDQYSFVNRIESFISEKISSPFNLMQFISDQVYRENMIKKYDSVKSTYNILDIISTVPHFKAMFDTLYINDTFLNNFSIVYNIERKIIPELKDKNGNQIYVNSDMFKELKNTIYDEIILNGIKSMNLRIDLPNGFKHMKGIFTNWESNAETITLDSNINIANFKKLMDEVLIPQIIETYPNEEFTKALTKCIKEIKGANSNKFFWRLILHMMNIDATTQTQTMYEDILKSFDAISNQKINGWKIADLFYLYNLIVNKDSFGGDSFTRLFENLNLSQNSSNLINQFYEYISKLDNESKEVIINLSNIKYRLSKLPNSRIVIDQPINFVLDPNYFTFDLPFDTNGNYITISNNNLLTTTDQNQLNDYYQIQKTSYDILIPFIKTINEKFGTNIHIVTNDDANENERAYIEDGEMYINIDRADITDIFHELGHSLFAALKILDPNSYYKVMNSISAHSKFDQIAKAYSNKHGSDLQEEVFLKLMQSELQGILYSKDTPLLSEDLKENVYDIVYELLSTYNINNQEKTLSNPTHGIRLLLDAIYNQVDKSQRYSNKELIIQSQKIATIKDNLVKDNYLKEDCSNL